MCLFDLISILAALIGLFAFLFFFLLLIGAFGNGLGNNQLGNIDLVLHQL